MSLILTDDARLLRHSVDRLFASLAWPGELRRRRDAGDLAGVETGPWDRMIELGLPGVLVPETFGGSGLGVLAAIQVSEAMGQALITAPFLSTIMATTALLASSNDPLRSKWFSALASGSVIAIGGEERSRHSPERIETVAQAQGGRFLISGRKTAVIDGATAASALLVARCADTGGLLAFLIDLSWTGIAKRSVAGLDGRPLTTLTLSDVAVPQDRLVCQPSETRALLDATYDAGRLHLAAEMLGAAQSAFDQTLGYLKTRMQFGRPIGEFQALQHRAAILFGEMEVLRSVVLKAATLAGPSGVISPELASLAKAQAGKTANRVAAEAVQLHGGIGVTDEFNIGLFLKRIRVASEQLGDGAYHADRYCRLHGF